jgi:hypothetical protein
MVFNVGHTYVKKENRLRQREASLAADSANLSQLSRSLLGGTWPGRPGFGT